jgi:hypothetical protein
MTEITHLSASEFHGRVVGITGIISESQVQKICVVRGIKRYETSNRNCRVDWIGRQPLAGLLSNDGKLTDKIKEMLKDAVSTFPCHEKHGGCDCGCSSRIALATLCGDSRTS